MGRIGVVLSFEQRTIAGVSFGEVKVDFGGDDSTTCPYYPPTGSDSYPLAGDLAFCAEAPGGGGYVVTGTLDPALGVLSAEGEAVMYSRSASGELAAIVRLKADGTVDLNDGALVLKPDGTLENGGDVKAGSVSLQNHTHGYVNDIFTVPDGPSVPTDSTTEKPS